MRQDVEFFCNVVQGFKLRHILVVFVLVLHFASPVVAHLHEQLIIPTKSKLVRSGNHVLQYVLRVGEAKNTHVVANATAD